MVKLNSAKCSLQPHAWHRQVCQRRRKSQLSMTYLPVDVKEKPAISWQVILELLRNDIYLWWKIKSVVNKETFEANLLNLCYIIFYIYYYEYYIIPCCLFAAKMSPGRHILLPCDSLPEITGSGILAILRNKKNLTWSSKTKHLKIENPFQEFKRDKIERRENVSTYDVEKLFCACAKAYKALRSSVDRWRWGLSCLLTSVFFFIDVIWNKSQLFKKI